MKLIRCACEALVLLLTVPGFAGQEASVGSTTGTEHAFLPAITVDAAEGLIHLDAVVTGPAGSPVAGLRLEDFTLLDNGQPQKILSFHAPDEVSATPDPPSRLILVIDAIDLDELPPELVRDESVAVEHYLRTNGGRLTRPVSVYLINAFGLWTVAHPSDDGNAMADDIVHNQLKSVRPFAERPSTEINGGIAPHDTPAISALKSIGQIATFERSRPGRKLLVWVGPSWGVGPGLYNTRKTKKQDPLDTQVWFSMLMREARIVLYSLAVAEHDTHTNSSPVGDYWNGARLSPPKATYMSWDRKQLAVDSGGLAMDASFDIQQQIENCVREADSFYTITFEPAHAESRNEYHTLKVMVGKAGLAARTNAGYYDQPWYAVDRDPPARSVTVRQLEQMLAANRAQSDAELAGQMADVELSERFSGARLAASLAAARGKRTREALRILADASVFLDPPPEDILADAPPDSDAQRRILSLTADYLTKTIHKLPDYVARRTIARYQETPPLAWGSDSTGYRSLHLTDTLSATVFYRNGTEVAEQEKLKGQRKSAADPQLSTYGTFGPILAGLLDVIARHADMAWNRWEQGAAGPVAVFRYIVPAEVSRYQAKACCLPDGDGRSAFLHYVGYHGEVGIDPQNGTILRLEWSADLNSTTPIAQSKVMIEYGLVEIGGAKYVCPVRSISMMRARSVVGASAWDESFMTYGPYATMLNEIEFSDYIKFGSTARILPGFIPPDDDK